MMKHRLSRQQIIALGFILIIALGTLALMAPFATRSGQGAGFFTAFFTAVSASCVTGLVCVDTGSFWSVPGQAIILALIQIGGLGFITIATLFTRLVRKRVSRREQAAMAESINTVQVGRIMSLTRTIGIGTLIVELAGAALLAVRFVPQFDVKTGLWYALFHSVSAFCNAGFDLMGASYEPFCSFTPYVGDGLVTLTLSALVVIGGIGFLVWDDLRQWGLRWQRYPLHTKLTLSFSLGLIGVGTALFFVFEKGHTSAGMTTGQQLLASFFSAVTPRTAGFNTVDTAALSPASRLLTGMLMFIGGSSGSTAGGIKTSTFAVLLLSVISTMRGRRNITAFGRRLPEDAVKRAAVAAWTNLLFALIGATIILCRQELPFADVLFEVFSAIGTVGMSTGVTRALSTLSLGVVAALMYCGRVGSVAFAIALLEKKAAPPVTYPEEQITIG